MKEALKLALDLAIMHHSDDGYAELRSKVRQLAKEALAQPEQPSFNEWTNAKLASHYFDLLKVVERYEKHGVTCQTFRHFVTEPCAECNCVAPITAIKEALAQPEQEPMAWEQFYPDIGKPQLKQEPVAIYRAGQAKGEGFHVEFLKEMGDDEVLLYTTPPKRPWAGLTDAEMQALWDRYAHMEMMRAIEAKLKEKNT